MQVKTTTTENKMSKKNRQQPDPTAKNYIGGIYLYTSESILPYTEQKPQDVGREDTWLKEGERIVNGESFKGKEDKGSE